MAWSARATIVGVRREFSAGGVVVRRLHGAWHLAAIRPGGERPEEAAAREVAEETGVEARLVRKLGDVRYVYTWAGERIFKIVSFYLFRYRSGRLGEIAPEHAHEVAEVRWLPLADAPGALAYRGEQDMARQALAALRERPDPL